MMNPVVVGAGPAGMAAARAAAAAGVQVLLVDAEPKLGGQFHRQQSDGVDGFRLPSNVVHLPESVVWAIEPVSGGHRVHIRTGPADAPDRTGSSIDTAALVLATGAHDRALPFPGWDLPGVVTAGGAQALAKGHNIAIGRHVLLAGTGPFLLPVAASLLDVGARLAEVLDANTAVTGWLRLRQAPSAPPSTMQSRPEASSDSVSRGRSVTGDAADWLRRITAAAVSPGKAAQLSGYLARLARHRVPYRSRQTVVAAHGGDRVTAATVARLDADWRVVPGSRRRIAVDAVCVGFGFTPQLELATSAGCAISNGFVVVDIAQATSVPGVFAAGELTGIGGAVLSADEGTVAGTAAAIAVGAHADRPVKALRGIRTGRRFAAGLEAVYPIKPGWSTWLREDTVVCRCEEVTYGELCTAINDHRPEGVRTLRLASRAGLGRCQGKVCGRNVAELAELRAPEAAFANRPIATPIRLSELADPAGRDAFEPPGSTQHDNPEPQDIDAHEGTA